MIIYLHASSAIIFCTARQRGGQPTQCALCARQRRCRRGRRMPTSAAAASICCARRIVGRRAALPPLRGVQHAVTAGTAADAAGACPNPTSVAVERAGRCPSSSAAAGVTAASLLTLLDTPPEAHANAAAGVGGSSPPVHDASAAQPAPAPATVAPALAAVAPALAAVAPALAAVAPFAGPTHVKGDSVKQAMPVTAEPPACAGPAGSAPLAAAGHGRANGRAQHRRCALIGSAYVV